MKMEDQEFSTLKIVIIILSIFVLTVIDTFGEQCKIATAEPYEEELVRMWDARAASSGYCPAAIKDRFGIE